VTPMPLTVNAPELLCVPDELRRAQCRVCEGNDLVVISVKNQCRDCELLEIRSEVHREKTSKGRSDSKEQKIVLRCHAEPYSERGDPMLQRKGNRSRSPRVDRKHPRRRTARQLHATVFNR
jgi:hypothetical protein